VVNLVIAITVDLTDDTVGTRTKIANIETMLDRQVRRLLRELGVRWTLLDVHAETRPAKGEN